MNLQYAEQKARGLVEDDDDDGDNGDDDDQEEREEGGGCAGKQVWRLPCDVCVRIYAILVRSDVVPSIGK